MRPASSSPSASYLEFLSGYDASNPVVMDLAHIQLICGVIFAHKPARLLELGIGTGFLTRAMLLACAGNGRGKLTSVDNAHDWGGVVPRHFKDLEAGGAQVVIADEGEFLSGAAERYDLIVSDGDHRHGHIHAARVMAAANDRAFVFFHDTANPQFPNLADIRITADRSGFAWHEFTAKSVPGERTDRGLLMVINSRKHTWQTPLRLRGRHALGRVRRRWRKSHGS